MPNNDNLLLIQTSIGDYRQSVIDIMYERMGGRFKIYCGKEYFYPSLKTGIKFNGPHKLIENKFFANRKILVQIGVITEGINADNVILELNPRIITNWIIAISRKLLGRHTSFWGHAWARNGPNSKSDPIREIMRRLGNTLIVYTETQKEELITIRGWSSKKIFAAPNALYKKSSMSAVKNNLRKDFISVGRLVKEKKISLLIESFSKFSQSNKEAKLHIVGSGPEEEELKELAKKSNSPERIIFHGHISDPEKLKLIYNESIASISTGYVGLSVTQSLGFGVPMIISKDEPHAPEIEAAKDGFNCIFFETNSIESLAESMNKVIIDKIKWIAKSEKISAECQTNYSAEKMADRLMEAAIGRK